MQRRYFKQLVGFALILDLIILDQVSKWLVLEYVLKPAALPGTEPYGILEWFAAPPLRLPPVSVELLPFFNLVMVWNEGVSFGLMQMQTPYILISLALVISLFFAGWLLKAQTWFQAIALAMVIGGALGNVIDRLRLGAVADFLDFHAFGLHYPAFNVADSCITLGIAFLVFDGLLLEPKRKKAGV